MSKVEGRNIGISKKGIIAMKKNEKKSKLRRGLRHPFIHPLPIHPSICPSMHG